MVFVVSAVGGGEIGIRTLEALSALTHFPGVRLRPLGHLSSFSGRKSTKKYPSPALLLKHFFIFKKIMKKNRTASQRIEKILYFCPLKF